MTYLTLHRTVENLPPADGISTSACLDVGVLDQFGPTCGFYSLYLVLDYWHRMGKAARPLPPRFRHSIHRVRDPDKPNSLRAVGKKIRVTTQGTVLSTDNLGKVAREAGNFDYRNVDTAGMDDFFKKCMAEIQAGFPIIIGIDVGIDPENGGMPAVRASPATAQDPNKGGHWAVLCGFRTYPDSAPRFIASHWGEYWIWEGTALYQSNHGLNFYPQEHFVKKKVLAQNQSGADVTLGGKTYRPGSLYFFNDFALVDGLVDIEDIGQRRTVPLSPIDGMRGKLLVVYPRQADAPAASSSSSAAPRRGRIDIGYDSN